MDAAGRTLEIPYETDRVTGFLCESVAGLGVSEEGPCYTWLRSFELHACGKCMKVSSSVNSHTDSSCERFVKSKRVVQQE